MVTNILKANQSNKMGKMSWSEESGMVAFSSHEPFLSALVTLKDNSRLATEPANGSSALQACEWTAPSGGGGPG